MTMDEKRGEPRRDVDRLRADFDRVIYGANGSIGLVEAMRTVNTWIAAHEILANRDRAEKQWWQHDLVKMFGGAVLALGGALVAHYLFR